MNTNISDAMEMAEAQVENGEVPDAVVSAHDFKGILDTDQNLSAGAAIYIQAQVELIQRLTGMAMHFDCEGGGSEEPWGDKQLHEALDWCNPFDLINKLKPITTADMIIARGEAAADAVCLTGTHNVAHTYPETIERTGRVRLRRVNEDIDPYVDCIPMISQQEFGDMKFNAILEELVLIHKGPQARQEWRAMEVEG